MRGRLEPDGQRRQSNRRRRDAGNVEKGIEVALDVEELLHEVSILLNAASLFNRLGET
jgi:hypothetical protein